MRHLLLLLALAALSLPTPASGARGNDCAKGPATFPGQGAPAGGHFVRCAKATSPPPPVVVEPPPAKPATETPSPATAPSEVNVPTPGQTPQPATTPVKVRVADIPLRGPGPREEAVRGPGPRIVQAVEPEPFPGEPSLQAVAGFLALAAGAAGAILTLGRPGGVQV